MSTSEPTRPWRDAPTDGVRVRRLPDRGRYDRATIDAILDEALICHVATVDDDGRPVVLPTLHARIGDHLYLHGSSASRNLRRLEQGVDVCVEATLVDGLVLAHRVFNHSMNYRSVVVRGTARPATDDAELLRALEAFTERLVPGRWAETVPPDAQELKATTVLRLGLEEASAKVRSGPPGHVGDEGNPEDLWVGVVPLRLVAGAPEPHPALPADLPVSAPVRAWAEAHG